MSWISKNNYLTKTEQENNAYELTMFFKKQQPQWTSEAIAAMLGNMESESSINPGIWENLDEGNLAGGLGLVQWTPATKIINWAGDSWQDGTKQCERIIYELENDLQWAMNDDYPLTFLEFTQSTDDPYYLAAVFLNNYERPADILQPWRGDQALKWYELVKNWFPDIGGKSVYWLFP